MTEQAQSPDMSMSGSISSAISPHTHFVTQGMLIIDDIVYQDVNTPKSTDVLGGGGTYALMGARLFNAPPHSQNLKWIVDAGSDFPSHIEHQINQWDTGVVWRHDNSRKTTRGLNKYGDKQFRAFEYLAPRKRILADDLVRHKLYEAETMHLLCSPERCIGIIEELARHISMSTNCESTAEKLPVFVWEPVPDTCKVENLPKLLDALRYVQILSPNEQEFFSLIGANDITTGPSDLSTQVRKFAAMFQGHEALEYLVIRRGELGADVFDRTGALVYSCLPYFHHDSKNTQSPVVDPTGAGNCFLGGFASGYIKSGRDVKEAVLYGTVAASYAIEQIGLPKLTRRSSDGPEEWNGDKVSERLERLRLRIRGEANQV